MKIIVCIKQVPNTNLVKIDAKTGTLIRTGVPSIINPEDKNALEAALRIREERGGTITVLSMGPPQAGEALREALAMGADEAVLLSDRAFAGADTVATSYALTQGIRKLGDFDLILCGRQAIDGDTAQVGPQVAANLDIPQVTYVRAIRFEGEKLIVKRQLEDGYALIEASLPCLLTVVQEINTPRYPSIAGIVNAAPDDAIKVWSAADIAAKPSRLGLKGSPTQVKHSFTPKPKGKGTLYQGKYQEAVRLMVEGIKAHGRG